MKPGRWSGEVGGAVLSPDGTYRYVLERFWQAELGASSAGRVLFVMLNPSTADALRDDPTVRRCVGFARSWGYTELRVVNLFAYRAPTPSALHGPGVDPVGPDNDYWIAEQARAADLTVCAWGAHRPLDGRDGKVLDLLDQLDVRPHALALTASGSPRHPLYVRRGVSPFRYRRPR